MRDFWYYIVLGQVPGTHIQVNFETWLAITCCLALIIIGIRLARQQTVRYVVLLLQIRHILQTASYSSRLAGRSLIRQA